MGLTSSHGSCLSSDTAVEPSASSRGTPRVRVPKKNRTTTPPDAPTPTDDERSYVTEYEYDEGGSAIYWPSSSLDDDRDDVVAFDFSAGSEFLAVDSFMDPCSLVGYEVHVAGEGVGHIASVNKPSFTGVSFDVQFQDGRRLNVGLQSDSVTFLQRLY